MSNDLIHICDWLPPDFGAVGQYVMLKARKRAEGAGHYLRTDLGDTNELVAAFKRQTKVVAKVERISGHWAPVPTDNCGFGSTATVMPSLAAT